MEVGFDTTVSLAAWCPSVRRTHSFGTALLCLGWDQTLCPGAIALTPLGGCPFALKKKTYGFRVLSLSDGYAMGMSPNKDETAVHGCHCPSDMAVRMRKVLQTAGLVFEAIPCYSRLLTCSSNF